MKLQLSALLRRKTAILLTGLLLLISGQSAFTDQKGATLLGYAVFPDIVKTLDMIEKIAGKVDPNQFRPGALKGQIGMMLNDPSLANIDRTKPLMVTVYYQAEAGGMTAKGVQNISYAAFIPAKNSASYKKVFDGMQMPSAVKGGVLVVGNRKQALDTALATMDLYKKTSADKVRSDIRTLIKIDNIISIFNTELSGFVSQMQTLDMKQSDGSVQSKQSESLVALGKLFMYGIIDMASQSKDYQLDISVDEKTLLFSSEHSAKPGTPLYNFFDGTPPDKNSCLPILTSKGEMTYAGYFDMKRLNSLIDIIVTGAIKRDPSLKDKIDMSLINEYRNFIGYYLGEFAFVYGFDDNLRFRMDIAASTNRSAESHVAMNEKFITIYRETLKKLSAGNSNIPEYRLEKNVRKSGAFDVHRYILKMDYSSMSETEKASMKKLFGGDFTSEYAVANGFVVMSTDPKTLDRMISNTTTGSGLKELQAMRSFSAGMDSYCDIDIAGFIKKIALMAGTVEGKEKDPEMQKTLDMLDKMGPEERTLVTSSKYSKGTSFNKYQVSVKMMTDMAKYFKEQKASSSKNGSSY